MSCFALLIASIAGWKSEPLPTDWGEKHPDGRVWKSHPAKRQGDNTSEREFIKVRYWINNHVLDQMKALLDMVLIVCVQLRMCIYCITVPFVGSCCASIYCRVNAQEKSNNHLCPPSVLEMLRHHYVQYITACRAEESLAVAQQVGEEMSEKLQTVTQDKQNFDFKTAAELDDLYRTKKNLEERLVELIRCKNLSYITHILGFGSCLTPYTYCTRVFSERKMHFGRRQIIWSFSRN